MPLVAGSRRRTPVAVVVVCSALLAACHTPASTRPQTMTDSGQFAALQGTRWQSATLPDGSSPVAGLEIWWEVAGSDLTASRGCAATYGPVDIVGGRLILGNRVTPAVGCGPEVDREAQQWADMLASGPEILVDLGASPPAVVLDNGSHRMTFTPAPPAGIRSDSVPTG
ncbi:hypothetical protein FDO65_15190 [Nakamurella flava]|uniref:META domain-containing protein n=1 Tax=Nakamurella flava TaxID=2576308 RepID=A0A4U6QF17_9ACTN|nr:hypothetical protein [Nakamurella flava]TKV58844.1 hypothetical protein FDO65_15190 [Nakamurella flava]